MKRFILFATVVCSLLCFGEESQEDEKIFPMHENFGYFSLNSGPIPLPSVGVSLGYRSRLHDHALDYNLRETIIDPYPLYILSMNQVKFACNSLYYVGASSHKTLYFGVGAGVSVLTTLYFDKSALIVSPEFRWGKEFPSSSDKKQFWQLEVSWPSWELSHHHEISSQREISLVPFVGFSYGRSF